MDVYQRLRLDHEVVSQLFERLGECAPRAEAQRSALFASLRDELLAHLQAEQEVFYNALLARLDEQDLLLEAYEEHTVVERLLEDIESSGVRDRHFETRVAALRDAVEQHIAHEESVIFETARKHLPADEAYALGAQLEARKEELE